MFKNIKNKFGNKQNYHYIVDMENKNKTEYDLKNLTPDKIWFTADLHFLHYNIIKYCNRSFSDTKEMNKCLVDNWNKYVLPNDLIFICGDLALGNPKDLQWILSSLNGHKALIKGNHEKTALQKEFTREFFDLGIYDLLDIVVRDEEVSEEFQRIVLCHYPLLSWNSSHRGSWNLFGHQHGNLNNTNLLKPNQIDVGVDCSYTVYYPLSYQRVKEIITELNMNGNNRNEIKFQPKN